MVQQLGFRQRWLEVVIMPLQEVANIGVRDRDVIGASLGFGVGGADQRLAQPGNDKEDPAISRVQEQEGRL